MSFWKKMLGLSKKETQIIEEPEHDLAKAPPDDLMIVKDEEKDTSSKALAKDEENVLDIKKEELNNKDSP